MKNLSLTGLKKCFEKAIEEGFLMVGVAVQAEGMETPEIIINSHENFQYKLSYYLQAYNEDLTLKTYNKMKIVGYICDDYADTIVSELLY